MWNRSSPETGFPASIEGPDLAAAYRRNMRRHCALLGVQILAVAALYAVAVPIFVDLVSHLGTAVDLAAASVLAIIGFALIQQACYWARRRIGPIQWPLRSVVLSHLFRFLGRISFFFGGALFSSIFYRHIPELEMLPPSGQIAGKMILVLAVLFCLFCFSLELERVGIDLDKWSDSGR